MIRLQRMFTQGSAFPSTSSALFAIIACPILFAAACLLSPPTEALQGMGLEVNTWQVFKAGFGAYCFLLCRHRFLNGRYVRRHFPQIERHRSLTKTQQGMIVAGMTETPEYRAVVEERDALGDRLGWLVDADNFYRKLSIVTRCLTWLRRKA